ncbi:hypothetical protein JM83_3912 [Gillisia sp. Hel_I_86]|uniref:hypothetical protein n=1 Tax=Gillisia sp. Hel_I_86 TaxID=1249981 RepID=UPI00119A3819|nr:hypothetical protein [Gillisia sp. Hel_I_86]TVZ28761.1 hypothetical protein JM83_3912 [Gillisia sp. Hel_I_86]
MKNLLNSMKVAFTIISCLVITLFFTGCKDDDIPPPDCGCESETRTIIPESTNLIGQIAYKTQIDSQDDYYNNTFWIGYTEQNCSNCIHHMIVCNEDLLGSEFDDIIVSGEVVEVKFSGNLKRICELPVAFPADETFEYITLTSIERL